MTWFALHIELYDSDTAHLSTLEHGAYFLLIKHYMRTRSALPDNDRALAHIAGLEMAGWLVMAPTIRGFFSLRSGKLHQKRCDTELDAQDHRARRQSEHAKKAADARWNEIREMNAAGTGGASPSDAPGMPDDATRQDKTRQDKTRKDKTPPHKPPQGASRMFASFWEVYPHKVGKGAAHKAWDRAITRADPDAIIAGIERYIASKPPDRPWCNPTTFLNQDRWLDEPQLPIEGGHNDRHTQETNAFAWAAARRADRGDDSETADTLPDAGADGGRAQGDSRRLANGSERVSGGDSRGRMPGVAALAKIPPHTG